MLKKSLLATIATTATNATLRNTIAVLTTMSTTVKDFDNTLFINASSPEEALCNANNLVDSIMNTLTFVVSASGSVKINLSNEEIKALITNFEGVIDTCENVIDTYKAIYAYKNCDEDFCTSDDEVEDPELRDKIDAATKVRDRATYFKSKFESLLVQNVAN